MSLYKIKNSASEFRNTHIVSPQFKRNGKKPCQNVGSFYDIPEPVCYDLFNWFRCFFRFNCKKIVLRKSVLPFFIKSKGSRYRNPLKNQKGQKKYIKKGHRNKNSVLLAKRGSLPEAKEWLEDDCDNLVME